MKRVFTPALLLLLLLSASFSVSAQTNPLPKANTVSDSYGKPISVPQPEYPADARNSGLSVEVKVTVFVDETGKVYSVKAVEGPEKVSFRQAAETAAMRATFSQTLRAGKPIKTARVILYSFKPARTYEAKLKVLGISTFIKMARHFTDDIHKFYEAFDSADMFKEGAAEFPEFSKEFLSISSLKTLPVDKRIEAIDNALLSIRTKSNESEKWQFEVGQNLADIMGPMMLLMANGGKKEDLIRLAPALKLSLNKTRQLTLSAPTDFPADVLAKLTEFSALGSRDELMTQESIEELFSKMTALLETISPDSTK